MSNLIADLVKKISFSKNPSFPAMELSDIVRQQPQVIIVEKSGKPDESAEQAENKAFFQAALLALDAFQKSMEEKPFHVPFDRL